MAFLIARKSRGKSYWSIVESRRINGKPKHVIIQYLGTVGTLLNRLNDQENISLKSYSHGDTMTLINIAKELDIINVINKYIATGKNGKKPIRDKLTVGGSFVLAAIGRACHPTSKMGWYDWCKTTSLEYCLESSFKGLTSQHFWDQMDLLRPELIADIEENIVKKLISSYHIKLDCLLFDTTNFFTFIDSSNHRCDIPQRGRNKQKRSDLRQIGMALLVSRKEQFPLFHKTYRGNKNDISVFKEIFSDLILRLRKIYKEVTDLTIIFDKGNNSKENFAMISKKKDVYYVGGLVPSYFKDLIREANKNFETMILNDEEIPVYRIKREIWGEERTCVITISKQLKEGQIRGILQTLERKYKKLNELKQQLENPRKRKSFDKNEIQERLNKIIRGQFIEEILKYKLIKLKPKDYSFTYYIDSNAFEKLKDEILGRRILVTNRHQWRNEEILLAYRGQSKVEYAFRNFKNPYHMAIRPQYHWTDQKIEAHILICMIGYLLTVAAYTKAQQKAEYKRDINHFMDDLKRIRLSGRLKRKSRKVKYQLEEIPESLRRVARILEITDENIRPKINFSVYT